MRLAWFSPLPPVRSGVAAYSAELLPLLGDDAIDTFVDGPTTAAAYSAHDFLWRQRRQPYDLVVYQLGNAPYHDYLWGYLAAFPGLVVLHDARLHHARARQLLGQNRAPDYRAEFAFDHPDAVQAFTDYAVEGLGGPIYYYWSMLRVVMRTARAVAVHNERVASDLRAAFPETAVETIRMGVAASSPPPGDARARDDARAALGIPPAAVVYLAFGKITAEKRVAAILRAFSTLVAEGLDAYLLFVGDDDAYAALGREAAASGRVRVAGHVNASEIGRHLAAADVCLCLRWPTALETSASWLRALAAGRATCISTLAHLVDVPALDARGWRATHTRDEPVAVAIDLLDEDRSLVEAMRRLAADPAARDRLAAAGHRHWSRHHTLETMAADYRRVIESTRGRPAPRPVDLPAHFTDDHSRLVDGIARQFAVDLDV